MNGWRIHGLFTLALALGAQGCAGRAGRIEAPEAPRGLGLPSEHEPRPGLYTGGVPDQAALEAAKARGVVVVVSLLPDGPESQKERDAIEALGMEAASIPVRGAEDLTEANARALGDVLTRHAGQPAIVHCGSGNRAGALLSLEAYYVEGQSVGQALAFGRAAGLTKLEGDVQRILQEACAATPDRC